MSNVDCHPPPTPTTNGNRTKPDQRPKTEEMMGVRPTIVLFGDSITQQGFGVGGTFPGWAALLAGAYSRRADVLNRGFSGYNTRHALDILPSVFGPSDDGSGSRVGRPLFATVLLGANDASLPGDREGCQHVPIDEYEDNLKRIVKYIGGRFRGSDDDADNGTLPIILITPPPVDRTAWDKYCTEKFGDLSPRTNEVARQYGERVKYVASEFDCPVVDSYSLFSGHDSEEVYGKHLEDGLHLNGSGNRILFEGIMDVLLTDFSHLSPMEDGDGKYGDKGIPLEGPLWTELCP